MEPENDKERLFVWLGKTPWLAHQALFKHRHTDLTPPFHLKIIADLHGDHPRLMELAFRGAGKSTLSEEYIIISALYNKFRNFIIIGESFTRAAERLWAIKHEFDFNEEINTLFGSLHGPIWNEDKIELSNGVTIQAFGRGMSLRGVKHNDARPDGCLIDDIEDEESVNTPEGRDKTQGWLMRTLLPALAPGAKVRMLANMLDPDCLAVRLRKTGVWRVREYPWEYISHVTGERRATWPARFPLSYIDDMKSEYEKAGMLNEYQQEFMVEATDPSTRTFTTSMIRVEPRVRKWEPTYAMYDPARTVKAKSAHTGKVVFSWIGTRLIIWEGDGQLWMPDRIIQDMFETSSIYSPVEIGIEKVGLEEFIMQPLRAEQIRRQQIIPVRVMPAPVGKLGFIRSLQPYFSSGEVTFAKELPVLKAQLLSFPTGRIDVPNALAYALRMRPGLPIYENFTQKNVVEDLSLLRSQPCHLALGATRQYTTAALVQISGTALRVLSAYVREGDPGLTIDDILTEVRVVAGDAKLSVYAGREHWGAYDTIGLQAACRRARVALKTAGDPATGREQLRAKIDQLAHGRPALQVSTDAKWVLNGFAGGYARSVKQGAHAIVGMADEGPYKTLMEALEAFVAVTAGAIERDGEDRPNYDIDASGRKYLSARGHHGKMA